MSHLRRVSYVFSGLMALLVFIVMLTQLFAPLFAIAHQHHLGPFAPALAVIETVSFWLLVPIFGLSLIAFLLIGPAQEELQKEKRRQGL